MFCVIQEIETKKANKNGHAKEIITKYLPMSINGEDMGHWWYYYGEDKFERPVKKAYKISIHHSYRDNGKVKKKQFVLATVNYYDFANDFFYLYDDCDTKINEIAKAFNTDIDSIYDMVEAKIKPLQEQIQAEFMETEEYKTHEEHEQITTIHAANKTKFAETYNVDSSEYDRCYDVFGTLHNPQRLKEIQQQAEFNRQYEEKSHSYQEQYYSNYNNYSNGSYHNSQHSNYNEENKEIYNQFYKALAKKFHPDANPDKDTTAEMTLLNQLKTEWGL